MINTLPLRRMTLHLAQRFRIDGDTFIKEILLNYIPRVAKVWIIHVHLSFVQFSGFRTGIITGQSGLEVLLR